MASISEVQLGKQGISENFVKTLKEHFKNHNNVKIKVLKSACRDKVELKEIIEKILGMLGKNFTARRVGYTVNVKKWRKDVRE